MDYANRVNSLNDAQLRALSRLDVRTAAIPGAEAVVLDGCGHMMTLEAPAATLDALTPWL